MDNMFLDDEEMAMNMAMGGTLGVSEIPVGEPTEMELTPSIEPVDNQLPTTLADGDVPQTTCGCGCDMESLTIGKYLGTLMESVQITWRYHLKAKKHSVHVILNEFYDEALESVDSIIEAYQGRCGIVDGYENCICDCEKTDVAYLTELRTFVVEGRSKVIDSTFSEIISDIDSFISIIDSALYKLNNLTESTFKTFDAFVYEDYAVCGVEGGVGGSFDTVTKSTKTNTAPAGAAPTGTAETPKSCKCKEKECDSKCEHEEEEEEEE